MDVPRTWWTKALSNQIIADSCAQILLGLLDELRSRPELAKVSAADLIALAFVDCQLEGTEYIFGNDESPYTIEEYIAAARRVLAKRPQLGRLGTLIEKKRQKERTQENEG